MTTIFIIIIIIIIIIILLLYYYNYLVETDPEFKQGFETEKLNLRNQVSQKGRVRKEGIWENWNKNAPQDGIALAHL